MILVVGATGMLGGEIGRLLRERGATVRALVRPGSPRTPALRAFGMECVEGDLKSPDSLRAACRGVRAVVSTANSALSRRKGDTIRTVDLQGHLDLVAAARAEGASRFVYTSVTPHVSAAAPFVRAKRRVEEAVRGSGLEWTILQPSPFMEIYLSKVAGWDLAAGVVTLLGTGRTPVTYVSYRDVAAVAALVLHVNGIESCALPIGGPDPISPLEAVRIFEKTLGRQLRVRHVPVPVVRTLAAILAPFDPVRSSLMTMAAETTTRGDVVEMRPDLHKAPIAWTSLSAYAQRVSEGIR